MASSRRTYDTDVITLRKVFAKDPGNSNVPALRTLTADGLGGTYWAVPSSLGLNPSFNEIITSAGTYTADLSYNKFRLLAGENIGMINGSPGSNETTLFAKAFSQFDISGENTIVAYNSNNQLDSSVTLAGQGGITLRGDPATNTLFIVGPASNAYTVSTGIYGFSQIKVVETTSSITSNVQELDGTFITATSPSTLLRMIGIDDIKLSTNVTTNSIFFTISTFTSKGYLDISANAYASYPSTLSTISSLYVQIPQFLSGITGAILEGSYNYSSLSAGVQYLAVSTSIEFDRVWGQIAERAYIQQLLDTEIVLNSNIQSTSVGLGTLGYISTGGGAVVGQSQLISTVQGLGTAGYISSGVAGDVTTANLVSTVGGLGSSGYVSSLSTIITSTIFNTGAISTYSLEVFGPATLTNGGSTILRGPIYLGGPTFVAGSFTGLPNTIVTPVNQQSTVAGLGTSRYVSTLSLQSTVRGLGTASYISSSQLLSTIAGLGSIGYLSSLNGFTISTGNVFLSSLNLLDVYTGDVNYLTMSSGSLLVNGAKITGGGGGGGAVAQIVAGTGISVSPVGGTGVVTITNTGPTTLYVDTAISSFSTALGPVGGGTGAAYNFSTVSSVYGSTFNTLSLFASTMNTATILPSQSNVWVAVGYGDGATIVDTVQYSGDGRNWSNASSGGFSTAGKGVAYNGSMWVAVGANGSSLGSIQTSTDGKNWSNITSGGFSGGGNGIAYNGTLWIAVGNNGDTATSIQTSVDGKSWSGITTGGFSVGGEGIAWNGLYWVAVGNNGGVPGSIQYSLDGSNWISATSGGFTTSGKGIAWNGSLWVAAGDDVSSLPSLQYSGDGRNWSNAVSGGFSSAAWKVAWNGSLWVAVGDDTTILKSIQYSIDGSNWNDIASGGFTNGSDGYGIAWNGSYWVAVGAGNTATQSILYSTDGINWSTSSSGGFSFGGVGVGFSSNLAPGYSQQNLTILSQNIPLFLTPNNQILAKPSSLVVNDMFVVDRQWKRLGVNCNTPAYDLDVNGVGHFLTLSTLGLNLSSINGANYLTILPSTLAGLGTVGYVSTTGLTSTVRGLGTIGYVSTSGLTSTVAGLATVGYVSTTGLTSTVAGLGTANYVSTASLVSTVGGLGTTWFNSTIAGLGTVGYVSTTGLTSTVAGLGTVGYVSTTGLTSTVGGLGQNYVSTASLVSTVGGLGTTWFNSTIAGLGTVGYVSTASLVSTVGGLGTVGYVSTSGLTSTVAGLGTFGFLSSLSNVALLSTQQLIASSIRAPIISTSLLNTSSLTSVFLSTLAVNASTITAPIISTLALNVSSINGALPGTGSGNGSSITVSTGYLYASSMNFVNVAPTRDNYWLAVGDTAGSGSLQYSSDGATWTSLNVFSGLGCGVAFNGRMWVAVGSGTAGNILYSYDGITWLNTSGATFSGFGYSVAWGGKMWVAVGSDSTAANRVKYSYDGITWFNSSGTGATFSSTVYGVAWNGRMWVALGIDATQNIKYSYDGINWINAGGTKVFATRGYGVATNGKIWVAVGTGGPSGTNMVYSIDGINWTTTLSGGFTSGTTPGGNGIAWNGSLWVAVGKTTLDSETIQYSVDGLNWNASSSGGFSTEGYSVSWNGSLWVAVGNNGGTSGSIQYSRDGINWLSNSSGGFAANGYGIGYSVNAIPSYNQTNLSILPQNIPSYLQSTNQIFAQPSSLLVNNTLKVDYFYNVVGINTLTPQTELDVAGTGRFLTASTQQLFASSIRAPIISTSLLNTSLLTSVFLSSLAVNASTVTAPIISTSLLNTSSLTTVFLSSLAVNASSIRAPIISTSLLNTSSLTTVFLSSLAVNASTVIAPIVSTLRLNTSSIVTNVLGVNTTTPAYTLDVAGITRLQSTFIQNAPPFSQNTTGADYTAADIGFFGGTGAAGPYPVYGPHIRSVIPSGSFQDQMRLDITTSKGQNDNTQWPRVSITAGSGGIGRVGIGFSSPQYQLDVSGNTRCFLSSLVVNGNFGVATMSGGAATNTGIQGLNLGTGLASGLNINPSGGNVGINLGAQIPGYPLDIAGLVRGRGTQILLTSTNNDNFNASLQWNNGTGRVELGTYIRDATASVRTNLAIVGANNTNTIPLMFFNMSSSRVAIGSNFTTPSYTLDVAGDGRFTGALQSAVSVVYSSIAASPTIFNADLNKYFLYRTTTASLTVTLPAASNGWNCVLRNMPDSTQNIAVATTGANTTVAPGTTITVVSDGTSNYAV